ncbi:MAG: 2-dehydropantoate 2-reductase [Candidatus Desulfofervidaceae bacterium]|nr:2-dehydropantoate 2-reductase [Candidatus Desulfofervidaceae bacterium]
MKVLVFGLGALGHVFAAFLQKAGHEVTGVGRSYIVDKVRQDGISVTGIWGEHRVKLSGAYTSVAEVPTENYGIIILAVKSYDTQAAVESLKPLVGPETVVICAQNGYGNYETAAEILGSNHVSLARVIFGAELMGPGEVKVTVCADDVILGSPKGDIPQSRLEEIANLFIQAGIPTRFSSNIVSYLWDKILYNCALNALGAILEVNYGLLGKTLPLKTIMDEIIKEIFIVARAYNIPLFWPSAEAYIEHFYTKLLPPTQAHRPSMLQDIQRGKKTEIDALNGAIVKLGKAAGIDTPVNLTITRLIKGKEQICRKKN